MLRLSVLDQSPVPEGSTAQQALIETVKLAQLSERLGYHRFWVSEHHNTSSLAHSSPEVFISHIAAHTSSIRVGTGGVMLPHYSAYKVAENFRLLEALYPGRIDVGLGRAPGGLPIATRALQEGKTGLGYVDQYPQQIADLLHYFNDSDSDTHRFPGLVASPSVDSKPEVWLLGSSGDSAALAAELGVSFAFAQFINGAGGAPVVKAYKEQHLSTGYDPVPRSMVAIFVICADTDAEAERLVSSFDYQFLLLEQGRFTEGVVTPEKALAYPYSQTDLMRIKENRKRVVVGSPQAVKKQLLELSELYETDEIMIATIVHDYEAKRKSFKLLAEAFGIQPPE
ncbi:LLM class flavin-dependent oxidoreductase [Paenibacillus solisilvae]|uniref:LLM class flavin-dependent oxidoreductase n=1 Tax=Paenibacillus solisilvae TaxID=2486751 RepID=A0ABW0W113_9BACL